MFRMRRGVSLLAAAWLLGAAGLVAQASSAQAAPSPGCSAGSGADDGQQWAVVGHPSADAVDVTTPTRHFQVLEADLGEAEPSGAFGTVVQSLILNSDPCTDLIVSAPGRNGSTGSVYILMGSDAGPGKGVNYRIPAPTGAGSSWGTSMAFLVTQHTLVIGAPSTPLSPHAGGAVWLYPLADDGGQPGQPQVVTQDTKGVPGTSEAGDRFGAALATGSRMVAIGAPGEAVGARKQAGAVTVLWMTEFGNDFKATVFTQNSPGFATTAESGDQFGAALRTGNLKYALAVGAPGESIGSAKNTGMVSVLTQGVTAQNRLKLARVYNFSQNSAGIAGSNETGDRWGSSLGVGNGCDELGDLTLAVGAPFEDVGKVKDAGSVTVFTMPANADRSCRARFVEGTARVGGTPAAGDHFGWSIGLHGVITQAGGWSYTWLAGAPGKDVGGVADAGVVYDFGTADQSAATLQPIGGPVRGGGFGTAIERQH